MRGSLKIGTIKGIEIKLHWTFGFVLVWGAFVLGRGGGAVGLGYGLGLTVLVFVVVFLHELGHSLVALAFHIGVQDITLFPLGGVARLEKMPSKPLHEFFVAAAGPAVNLVMALGLSPVVVLSLLSGRANFFEWMFTPFRTPTFLGVLQYMLVVNVLLLAFNLIPAFPMDGGRMLRAVLAALFGAFHATRIAVWVGQGIAFVMGGYGLWSRQWGLLFIALYLFFAAGGERQHATIQHRLRNIRAGDIVPGLPGRLLPQQTISEVAGTALRSAQASFPVMLDGTLLGILRRESLTNGNRWATVADIMLREFPRIMVDDSLDVVRMKLQEAHVSVGAVYDGDTFKGVIDFEDMTRAYQFSRYTQPGLGQA